VNKNGTDININGLAYFGTREGAGMRMECVKNSGRVNKNGPDININGLEYFGT
jgi:hypothetical protein